MTCFLNVLYGVVGTPPLMSPNTKTPEINELETEKASKPFAVSMAVALSG